MSDIDILFTIDGVAAVISETGKTSVETVILFDRNSVDQTGTITDKPQITLPTADLEGFTRSKATISIAGTTYSFMKPLDDGAGLTVAGLKEA